MPKSELLHIRLSEAELARVLQLPAHPADRSVSDTVRRLLALACDNVERSANSTGR
jgi:hypothetical protein